MKRFAILALTLSLLIATCLFSASAEEEPEPIVVNYGTITVIFDGNTSLDEAQRLAIVQMLAEDFGSEQGCQHSCCEDCQHSCENEEHAHEEDPQRNIICTLFGHDKIEEPAIIIEHCVRDEDPRCRENYGILTTCSRCDYYNFDIHTSHYISCH